MRQVTKKDFNTNRTIIVTLPSIMLVTLSIHRLAVFAFHGVLPEERRLGNTFEISLEMSYDAGRAVATDDLMKALDYASVCSDVRVIATENTFNLIETLAHHVGVALMKKYSMIESVTVQVHKHQLPIAETTSGATATVTLLRKDFGF